MLQIGDIKLDEPFFQAPLSGYTDYAMRKLAYDFGCPLTYSGVILAKSAVHPKILNKPCFRPYDDEYPVGGQIMGNEPKVMAQAAKALVEVGYDLIDLNFACPAPKVLRRQRGGALMEKPKLVMDIYRSVRDAIAVPLTVKLRKGYGNDAESLETFWQLAEFFDGENIDAMVIHGRSVKDKFTGKSDWQLLKEVKQKFPKTTIIGSGDMFEALDIKQKLKASGIDGVLLARGVIGNPWLFKELAAVLKAEPLPAEPDIAHQKSVILSHLNMLCDVYAERKVIGYFRKFAARYTKRHRFGRKTRVAMLAAKSKSQLLEAIDLWYV